MKTIYLDMDGTFADLYGVENWLFKIRAEDVSPYAEAPALVPFHLLARYLNNQKKKGNKIGIISWTSKGGSCEFNAETALAKKRYLEKRLPSVQWDYVHIIPYGTKKSLCRKSANDVLIDDDVRNLKEWGSNAYPAKDILKILKEI